MKFLLVVFVFGLSATGEPDRPSVYWKPYASREECDLVGRNFREVFSIPEASRSMSICVPEEAFRARDWQIVE
jgi:hypothetical protein